MKQATLQDTPVDPVTALLQLTSPSWSGSARLPRTDWDALCRLAGDHQLQPLLHERLGPLLEALPEQVRATLHAARTESAANAIFQEWEQGKLVKAFRERSIPLVLFKGLPLAQQLYGDGALRPTCDIDVIVHRVDLEASCALVEEMGWRRPEGWETFVDKNLDYEKYVGGGKLALEVHWTTQREGEFALSEARLWEETVEVAGGLLFSREMTLLSIVLHAVRHAFRPYRLLVDIAHAVALWNDTLRWERVVALADEARARSTLHLVLALACRDLGAPLPAHPDLARGIRRRRTRLALRLLPASRLLLHPSMGDLERYLVPLLGGAWRPAIYFLGDFFRTPRQIAAIYGLPATSPLIPLYYLLRPFLLARKYARRLLKRQP